MSDSYEKLGKLITELRKVSGLPDGPIYTDKHQRLHLIYENPDIIVTLKYPEPTEDEMLLAFDLKPELALEFSTIPKDIQLFSVNKDPRNIQYIHDSDIDAELAAVYWKGVGTVDMDIYYLIRKPHYFTMISVFKFLGSPQWYPSRSDFDKVD